MNSSPDPHRLLWPNWWRHQPDHDSTSTADRTLRDALSRYSAHLASRFHRQKISVQLPPAQS